MRKLVSMKQFEKNVSKTYGNGVLYFYQKMQIEVNFRLLTKGIKKDGLYIGALGNALLARLIAELI